MIGERLKLLRAQRQESQQDVCTAINIEQSTLANYENNKRIPKLEILLKIAEHYNCTIDYLLGREDCLGHGLNDGNIDKYGLDGPGIADMLGYPKDEEKAVRFSHKLALQIDFNGLRLADVANSIGVSTEIIWEWLVEKRDDYYSYYEKLSEYFNVELNYWTRPGSVSPGLEPTTQEYFLILKYRFQNQYDDLQDIPIEDFFPDCRKLSESELKWLNAFRQLNEDNKDIIMGKIKEYLKEQRFESVAADTPLKKTGTDTLGK